MNYKDEIKKKGLKLIWVADQIGISRSLFSQYLNGLRPMPEHIEKRLKTFLA